jgi:hypothetical protein
MYSTCISCYRDLGTNDVVSSMPVGRMLAFDSARGRLWIVCRWCRRWNLVPLEERWEAIDDAGRCFRDARRRTSTGQISLAISKDGTSLIHVGRADLPEFAAWRYGRQLVGRWHRAWRTVDVELASIAGGSAAASAATAVAAGLGLGPISAAAALLGVPTSAIVWSYLSQSRRERPMCWVLSASGHAVPVTVMGGSTAEVIASPDSGDGWAITLIDFDGRRHYAGLEAWRVLAAALAHHNRFGAPATLVETAVARIEAAGEPELFMQHHAAAAHGSIAVLPRSVRLALEIGLHEVSERRVQDGHMAELETEWQHAEEIANIADDLLISPEIHARLRQLGRSAHRIVP